MLVWARETGEVKGAEGKGSVGLQTTQSDSGGLPWPGAQPAAACGPAAPAVLFHPKCLRSAEERRELTGRLRYFPPSESKFLLGFKVESQHFP